ncbi:unnamed protein product [Candidula unifasciata]|uniref:Long-chain-fatty-acid--CoA ligase n=1 Tax=Candidula unifasciata TaxID=100452 RepID=A0A8S3ZBQ9_9EUPU|nr:unnamed protein product [Candidula unifasciata]
MKVYQKVMLGSAGAVGTGAVALQTMFPWLKYDLQLIRAGKKMIKFRDDMLKSLLIDKFEKMVQESPRKTFIIFDDNHYTYEYVDQMACRVANIAKSWGLGPRDCVAMMIQNEPAFIWTFLGLQKLGVAVAFINHNLRAHSLVHSVLAADPGYLIVGAGDALLEAVIEIINDLSPVKVYIQGLGCWPPPAGVYSLDPLMVTTLPVAISPTVRQDLTVEDTCCYIYTSGTTGNPKPSIISHHKAISLGCCMVSVGLSSSDTIYLVLPLYHSSGGGIGFFGALDTGARIILRQKFSASHFWSDCRQHGATVIQYIGELFRYLISQPPNKLDAVHKVRVAFGNGLRRDIWLEVSRRFQIPQIAEFFGSTEGTALTLNLANRPGAIGRMSPLLNKLEAEPKVLVKFDYATAQPIRSKNGRCIRVAVGEPGLFLSKVPDYVISNGTFAMYRSSPEAIEQKLVRDAFTPGDLYFNYGDVFFCGKGENVSTTELANIISALSFVHDANVYGVTIPGSEGRAGMVALTLHEGCNLGPQELKELYDHVCDQLPVYARPLFVRLLDAAVVTATFKQQKVQLMNEGYDLNKVKDPLYFLDTDRATYSRLTEKHLVRFLSSKL